ncbi:MAG: transglutaminase-like domain-containing protein [Lachnospira sp.]|nr:transglutaminase-like domain-containing protein [Lachnospira sp.]
MSEAVFCDETKRRIRAEFARVCRIYAGVYKDIPERIAGCGVREDEQLALQYIYACLPLSDVAMYPPETFRDSAERALFLRRTRRDVQELTDEMFLAYVLFPRVNEEELLPCREIFGRQLDERLGGLAGEAAAIAVNYWCAEQGTYHSDDTRTIAPLNFYRRGYGRCGEESAFAVNAMRAYGIPSRQVYVPRWAHCEDNHAWIEVWVDGGWHFTGACEPLEILDRGWFTDASSRAMLVHSRYFGHVFEPEQEEVIGREGVVSVLNQLGRYARTRSVRFCVSGPDGKPLSGVTLHLQLMNEAQYADIAQIETDKEGEARFTTGFGTLRAVAETNGLEAEALLAPDENTCRLRLAPPDEARAEKPDGNGNLPWVPVTFLAPGAAAVNTKQQTPQQKKTAADKLLAASRRRQESRGTWENPAIGAFLALPGSEKEKDLRRVYLGTLSEKDRTDVPLSFLTADFAAAWHLAKQTGLDISSALYRQYVLCPRAADEVLQNFRGPLAEGFSQRLGLALGKTEAGTAMRVWREVELSVRDFPERDRTSVVTSPLACFQSGSGSEESRRILFVAACRSLGIPARLDPVSGAPESWDGHAFADVRGVRPAARVRFRRQAGENLQYRQHWSVAGKTENGYRTLDLSAVSWTQEGDEEVCCVSLPAGTYRILTENRLPNGSIYGLESCLCLPGEETTDVRLRLREAAAADMAAKNALPDFVLRSLSGAALSGSQILGAGIHTLIWIEEDREPTEHILNELTDLADRLRPYAKEGRIGLVAKERSALGNDLVKRTLEALPGLTVYLADFPDTVEVLARKMYVDPDSLPLVLMTRDGLTGIYASSGYNVGTGAMIVKMFTAEEESHASD